MTTRVVVADEGEARFYDVENARAPLELVASIEDRTARLRDRDLESDRPGRAFARAAPNRAAMDGGRSARKQLRTRFARRIARRIEHARGRNEFDRLVLIAAPEMLGLIRPQLSESSRSMTAAEVAKDLTHQDEDAIRSYVPRAALSKLAASRSPPR